jgi:glycosyltransferase involved in cell wall biosynthesis
VAAQEIDIREPLHSNIHLFKICSERKNQPLSRLSYMFHVRKLFMRLRRQVSFDIVHQMNPVYTGISLSLLGAGIPMVLGTYVARWPDSADGDENSSVGATLASAFRTCTAALQQRFADHLLLTAPVAANRLVSLGRVRIPRSYIAHGIDTELFSPGETNGLEDKTSVLYLAHLTRRKGIFDLVNAFSHVISAHPDCTFYVVGTGPEAEAVRQLADQLNIAERIEFLGHVDRLATPAIYRNCSIYCLPSNGEPYATTVIEAMSCGKPIVFTNAGGLPHLVGPEGGIGVEVGDVEGLSQALCRLLGDPAGRKAMGERNRRHVVETMTWDRVIDRLEEIYIATIEGKRRHGGERGAPAVRRAASPEDCT